MFKWEFAHVEGFAFGPIMSRQVRISGPGFSRRLLRQEEKVLEIKTMPSPYDRAWTGKKMIISFLDRHLSRLRSWTNATPIC